MQEREVTAEAKAEIVSVLEALSDADLKTVVDWTHEKYPRQLASRPLQRTRGTYEMSEVHVTINGVDFAADLAKAQRAQISAQIDRDIQVMLASRPFPMARVGDFVEVSL